MRIFLNLRFYWCKASIFLFSCTIVSTFANIILDIRLDRKLSSILWILSDYKKQHLYLCTILLLWKRSLALSLQHTQQSFSLSIIRCKKMQEKHLEKRTYQLSIKLFYDPWRKLIELKPESKMRSQKTQSRICKSAQSGNNWEWDKRGVSWKRGKFPYRTNSPRYALPETSQKWIDKFEIVLFSQQWK